MTYRQLLTEGGSRLKSAGIINADDEARYLLLHCFDLELSDYALISETEAKEDEYFQMISERMSGKPLQYITGTSFFYGEEFIVDENVLIPRFDTEILVEHVLSELPDKCSVLDLCTGSGCIVISLVKNSGKISHAVGTDISEKALDTARENAKRLDADVSFIKSDIFDDIDGPFDVIVSNPPYIKKSEIEGLDDEVRSYEPYNALCGGEDGLFYYRKIISDALHHLNEGGLLAFEIGYDQREKVVGLMKENGYSEIKVIKDLAGLDRVISGRYW